MLGVSYKVLFLVIGLAVGAARPVTAALITFTSQATFLATAPIELTETFDSASPVYYTPQVTFGGVIFGLTPPPSLPPGSAFWVVNGVGSPLSNSLIATSLALELVHEIGFGAGQSVHAFGFTLQAGGSSNGIPARYGINVQEVDGQVTTLPLTTGVPDRYYFGFLSSAGIAAVAVRALPAFDPQGGFGLTYWAYDDFSRSSIAAVANPLPEPAAWLLLATGLLAYGGWCRLRAA